MMEKKDIAEAVGHIPSGLFIVCAMKKETKHHDGFLGSWIQQVSFDPLLVSLCVKSGRPAAEQILNGDIFSINVVGEHDKSYLKHFWAGYGPEKQPIRELIPHTHTDDGAIVFTGAKSVMVCRKVSASQPGDHHLVIAEVLESIVHEQKSPSMVHLRKSGLYY